MTASELVHRSGWERTKVHRMEVGQYELKDHDVLSYLGFCGVFAPKAKDLMALWRLADCKLGYWLSSHGEGMADSLRSLIYHEAAADRSTIYQPQLVHGLLQTAEYARARVGAERWRSPENIEHRVRVRMDRQHVLRVPNPASFTFYLHEQALRVEVGSSAIMHEQLLHLFFITTLGHVSVRVVQESAADELAFGGPFHLLEYDSHAPLVYLDNHSTGLFLEDLDYVGPYRALVAAIADVALDGGQSREFIADLANEYDRGSARDAGDRVEEEQF